MVRAVDKQVGAVMEGEAALRVPVGPDAGRWRTFQSQRLLVVAARTVTSTVRVLEVLPDLVRGDDRVCVVFAYDPTSVFNDGVLELLRGSGCRVMPWAQLERVAPDLVLSASENVDLPDGDCPVLVLPHGIGFQKLVPDSRGDRTRLSGMVPEGLLKRARLAVSHPGQEAQLVATHPQAEGATVLTGDPCYDRLLASLPQRHAYLRALQVEPGQRLVVVSSTWGPTSLIAREPELPARLLADLPLDEYRVAVVLHPNVWSAHGAWQIRTLQAAALEAGLVIVPPTRGWQAALVSASAVVGDHGSVTLYGAALDRPTLLGAFGDEAVAGTAGAELGLHAPRLDRSRPLRAQIEQLIEDHEPGRWGWIAERAFAEQGQAMDRLRTVVYGLLGLAEPTEPPPVRSFPLPQVQRTAVTSMSVSVRVAASASGWTLAVERRPASVAQRLEEAPDEFRFLACDAEESDPRILLNASAVVQRAAADRASALLGTRRILDTCPGSLIAATAAGPAGPFLARLRDGRIVEVSGDPLPGDPGVAAAAVYACLRAGIPLDGARLTVRVGATGAHGLSLRLLLPRA